jgi:hypothetical protein
VAAGTRIASYPETAVSRNLQIIQAVRLGETMGKTIKPGALCVTFIIALLCAPILLAQEDGGTSAPPKAKWASQEDADQPKQPVVFAPPAPVPAQIVTAKKVFISNSGDAVTESGFKYAGGNNRAYNELYAAMKKQGPYEIATAPADADLILEIHFNVSTRVDRHSHFQLLIRDPRTHVLLWGLHEPVKLAGGFGWKEKTEKNFNLAMANLVEEIKNLAAISVATSDNSRK